MEKLKIEITLDSGMLIGTGNDSFDLGGVDSMTITDGNGDPYIPGSSLKGKLRYIAEQEEELGKYAQIYFGVTSKQKENVKNNEELNMIGRKTAILIGDLHIKSKEKNIENLFEVKSENTIIWNNEEPSAIPRTNKRTVANVTFSGMIIIPTTSEGEKQKYVCKDKIEEFELQIAPTEFIKELAKSLETYYIGGQGSRGYGWIKEIKINSTAVNE